MNSQSRSSAIRHLIDTYPEWPVNIVSEDQPITSRVWGTWRWVLSIDGEVMFGNGLDPAIGIEEFHYYQGKKESTDVH